MVEQPLCFFSVVRYVADPIRDEAKNIGIVLLCPEKHFGKSKFLPSRLHLHRDTRRYAVLRSLIHGYQIELPGDYDERLYEETLFAPLPSEWTRDDLERLHKDCTNLIQFSRPSATIGDPDTLLNKLFGKRVQVKQSGTTHTQPRRHAVRIFRKIFHPYGLENWVKEDAEVPVRQHRFRFDIGITNGTLRYAIKTLSFQRADLQRVEETGGYYAHIWRIIRNETGAKGLWLVEPPKQFDVSQERYKIVTDWAVEEGIDVHTLEETEGIAQKIAREICHSLSSGHTMQW